MGIHAIDLTGKRFGSLVVIERNGTDKKTRNPLWLCRCDCGKTTTVRGCNLRTGNTRSCGCGMHFKEGALNPKYKGGHSRTRVHRIWTAMKSRCFNPSVRSYADYGGRGVVVCQEWKENFEAFYEWSIENGYADNLTIERKNVHGNYCPENCRWATRKEQSRNTRANVYLEIDGEKHLVCDLAEMYGLSKSTIYGRYRRGDKGKDLVRPAKASKIV